MFLKKAYSFTAEEFSKRITKSDFMSYCLDLYAVEKGILRKTYLSNYCGFSFSELLEFALIENSALSDWFIKADITIVLHASYEYDPDYSHVVAYINNRFNLSADVIAISAPEPLLFSNALEILSAYFSEECFQRGLVVLFSQSLLPLVKDSFVAIPEFSGVMFFDFRYTSPRA